MKRFRWLMLISVLVVIFAIIGCGSQTPKSTETKSTTQDTAQTQSSASTPETKTDSTQTQGNSSAPTNQDTTQTQSNGGTQSGNKDNAQVQGNANSQSTNKDTIQVQSSTPAPTPKPIPTPAPAPVPTPTPTVKTNPIVTITMANEDKIKLELYPELAPNTVKSFISLVKKGFYNGLIFHRVIPGFMIQGGDPNGNGTGGPGYSIKGEFANNSFANNLKHERGVLSMGRTSDPNSAGSQFFIMVANAPSLDNNYASFGKVISGIEAVDKIVNSPRDKMDKPLESQVMKSVTVDTLGVTYGEPEVSKK